MRDFLGHGQCLEGRLPPGRWRLQSRRLADATRCSRLTERLAEIPEELLGTADRATAPLATLMRAFWCDSDGFAQRPFPRVCGPCRAMVPLSGRAAASKALEVRCSLRHHLCPDTLLLADVDRCLICG